MPEQIPSAIQVTQQRDEQQAQALKREFDSEMSLIDTESNHSLRAAVNQFNIKKNRLRDKFDSERDPAKKQALEQQYLDMLSQFDGTEQGIKDKFQPQRSKLEIIRDAGMKEIQAAAEGRQKTLNDLRQLHAAGIITDPAVIRQAEFKLLLGKDIPLSAFRPQPNIEDRKRILKRDIGTLDAMLDRFTPIRERTLLRDKGIWWGKTGGDYVDPITGEERKLNPKNEEDAVIIEHMTALSKKGEELRGELHSIMLQNPAYRQTLQDQEDRQKAQRQYLPGNRTEKGGNIEMSLTNTISKQNKNKRIRVQSPSGQSGTVTEKELASYIAQGFKRI